MLLSLLEKRFTAVQLDDVSQLMSNSSLIRSYHSKIDDSYQLDNLSDNEKKSMEFYSKFHNEWRDKVPIWELIDNQSHYDFIFEAILPDDWNFKKDLFFIDKQIPGYQNILNHIIAFGQERIITTDRINYFDTEIHKELPTPEEILNEFGGIQPQRFILLMKPSKPEYEILRNRISDAIKVHKVNKKTFSKLKDLWKENALKNIHYADKFTSIFRLNEILHNQDVMVISPGPSLAKEIKKITTISKKFITIAVAQAVPALTKNNITPDFVIVADPADYSSVMDGFKFNLCHGLIGLDTISPSFISLPFTNIFLISNMNSLLMSWYFTGGKTCNLVGASVSVQAVSLASSFGAKNIAVIGQDLSFVNGKQYAIESNDRKSLKNEEIMEIKSGEFFAVNKTTNTARPMRQVKSWNNEDLLTTDDYYLFKRELEKIALFYKDKVNYWNFSKGGALINGYKNIDINDVDFYQLNHISIKLDKLNNPYIFKEMKIAFKELLLKNKKLLNYFSKNKNLNKFLDSEILNEVKNFSQLQFFSQGNVYEFQNKFDVSTTTDAFSGNKTKLFKSIKNSLVLQNKFLKEVIKKIDQRLV